MKQNFLKQKKQLALEVIESFENEITEELKGNVEEFKVFGEARCNVNDLETLDAIKCAIEKDNSKVNVNQMLSDIGYGGLKNWAEKRISHYNLLLRKRIESVAAENDYDQDDVEGVFKLFRLEWNGGNITDEETMLKAIKEAWDNGAFDSYNEDGEEDDENPISINIDYHVLPQYLGIEDEEWEELMRIEDESGCEYYTFFGASCMAKFAAEKFGGEWRYHYSEDLLIAYNNAYDFD